MPNPKPTCHPETLAAGPIAQIQRCPGCGVVSIHLGATTVRLEAGACESLWATLSEALAELHRIEVGAPVLRANAGGPFKGIA